MIRRNLPSYLALVLALFLCSWKLTPAFAEPVKIRAWALPGFARIVFDWPTPVTFKTDRNGAVLNIIFARPIVGSYQPITQLLAEYVSKTASGKDGMAIVLTLRSGVGLHKASTSGKTVIVDLVRGPKPKQAEAAEPEKNVTPPGKAVDVRVGVANNYTRIVFDWSRNVDYSVNRMGDAATIVFKRGNPINLSKFADNLPARILSATTNTAGEETLVQLGLASGAKLRHFRSDTKVVVDVLGANTEAGAMSTAQAKAATVVPVKPKQKIVDLELVKRKSGPKSLQPKVKRDQKIADERQRKAEQRRAEKAKIAMAQSQEEELRKRLAAEHKRQVEAASEDGVAQLRKRNKHSVAVIIGNKNYEGRTPAVDYAHNDADAMRKFVLERLAYRDGNIIDLRDAGRNRIEAVFGNERTHKGELFNIIRGGKSDVIVYYSGHGVPGLDDKRPYLLPVDVRPNFAEVNGYPIATLYKNLERLPARSVTIFLDACFSGDSEKGMLVSSASGLGLEPELPPASGGLTVITAAQGTELASWDPIAKHGLFTKHLLDALNGKADDEEYGNADGKVTLSEVQTYLDYEMTYQARRTWNRTQNAYVRGSGNVVLASVFSLLEIADGAVKVEEMDATYVVLKSANVRAGPSTATAVVGKLKANTSVNVTGKASGRNWYRLFDGSFVFGSLIQSIEARRKAEMVQPDKKVAPPKIKKRLLTQGKKANENNKVMRLATATPRMTHTVNLDAGLVAYQAGDYKKAFVHWQPAADQGNANAQFYVGGLYRDGAGVSASLPHAHFWWLAASENGHPTARRFLRELTAEMLPHELVAAEKLVKEWNNKIRAGTAK
jgi:hypothetical protein